MKPSGIGGQAVIEGVMMKNKDHYAIAVRKPDNEIVVQKDSFNSISEKHKIWKLPILRGILAFAESMGIGIKTLNFSASFFEEEEAKKESKVDKAFSKVFKGKTESILMAVTMVIAIVLAMGIFVVLPAFAAGLLGKSIASDSLVAFIEGIIRIALFVLYVFAISQLKDIKRVFMYHGAEHKTINCIENGYDLTVENVRGQSRQHKRCGTSFLFLVMFVSIIFFMFIRTDITWLRYASRILLIPVIAGVSYEFIRFAGRNDTVAVRVLSKPGMWLQGMTTREPDDDMIEVAIRSVEAVFDWRVFLGKEAEGTGITIDADNNGKAVAAEKKENRQNSNKKSAGNNQSSKARTTKAGNSQSKNTKSEKTANNSSSKASNNKNRKPAAGSQSNAYNKSAREMAATSARRETLKTMNLFEEDDEILKAVDDFVAITDEAAGKE
ncbi:Uncharacterized conserved protein YqhQ [Anaerocolumna xylanovorans DSM 12503]|uniref:Uncharacterized conserved protein YqhQ n=1 Tax=Anaerocolumna xylanovorans DSM 12503 TaxID=1121345 RepID=A0A1M7YN76_9FIRM|nr:DUF1385 domain-containing protein [Anaerocolumna xylanovorans]SHO54090.1 Uncharacterized conserved protein YqhQ [Anaerocolumna xylanovorans DSM 12503]